MALFQRDETLSPFVTVIHINMSADFLEGDCRRDATLTPPPPPVIKKYAPTINYLGRNPLLCHNRLFLGFRPRPFLPHQQT